MEITIIVIYLAWFIVLPVVTFCAIAIAILAYNKFQDITVNWVDYE